MGAQELSIGHWSGLGLTAFPLWRLEADGRPSRKRDKEGGEGGGGTRRWRREKVNSTGETEE